MFRHFSSNREYPPVVKDFKEEVIYNRFTKEPIIQNVTLEYRDGRTSRVNLSQIYKPDPRTLELFGMRKWDVEGVKRDNGYFGAYSCIEYKGKKAIVFCDDRDAIVKVVTDWYDDILYGKGADSFWDGDNRWNHDKPIIVIDKDKGYNLNAPHRYDLLCERWLRSLDGKWCYNKVQGDFMLGIDSDEENTPVVVTKQGTIRKAVQATPEEIEKLLKMVKGFTLDEIERLWIKQGRPCYYICGFEFKGAGHRKVTKEKALEYFKTHHSFDCSFNSAEWRVIDGEVALLFRDYSGSDYD